MTSVPILFDVDGVVLRPHPNTPEVYAEGVSRAFETWGRSPSEEDLLAFVRDVTVERMRETCARHGLDLADFWPERERQVSAFQRELIRREERALYEDVAVLRQLAADRPLGFVSNNQQATIEFLLEHFGLDSHVDVAYGREPTLEGFERTKPDPHYVELALEELGTETALYVGDRLTDVRAADRAGLDSVLLRRTDATRPLRGDVAPDHEITTLSELPSIVAAESQ